MKTPLFPKDEALRLETLHSLNLLDTHAEERFDRITRLGKHLFSVPICLVTLVDSQRQWFKSKQGLQACETHRDISFCGHTILDDELFVVNNALTDPRFADNPLVTGDPHIRFYAGHPLKMPNNTKIGTLCIIDRQPREFTGDDFTALQDLGQVVEELLVSIQLATIDELTGLPNRRGFLHHAEKALAMCQRESLPASLIYVDLNDFKQIND